MPYLLYLRALHDGERGVELESNAMSFLRGVILAQVLQVSGALACSCFTSGSACTSLRGTEVVFVGE
jgi:hypothetical protein